MRVISHIALFMDILRHRFILFCQFFHVDMAADRTTWTTTGLFDILLFITF